MADKAAMSERIKTARLKRGLSQSQLAKQLGVSRNAVSQWESGSSEPTPERLRQLCVTLNVDLQWLGTGQRSRPVMVQGLPLRGRVAAGIWEEIVESQDMEMERVPAAPDVRYPAEFQYALRVSGNSVDKIAADGSILHVLDVTEAGITVRNGDLVVVERHRGGLVEATVKRVKMNGAQSIELWPETRDPQNQKPIVLKAPEADTEIRIKALVLWVMSPVPRGE
jgi:transcriptional regulator with XRE-family HTH domain